MRLSNFVEFFCKIPRLRISFPEENPVNEVYIDLTVRDQFGKLLSGVEIITPEGIIGTTISDGKPSEPFLLQAGIESVVTLRRGPDSESYRIKPEKNQTIIKLQRVLNSTTVARGDI